MLCSLLSALLDYTIYIMDEGIDILAAERMEINGMAHPLL